MNTKSHDGRNDDVKKLLVVLLELHGHFSALKVDKIVSSIVLVQFVPDFSPDIKIGERSCTPEIKKT